MNEQAQQMSAQQQAIETNVRMTLGDLQLQLIVARARITELEQQLAKEEVPPEPAKPNGKDKPEMKAN
jgi:hypothetical protein